jgi:transposase
MSYNFRGGNREQMWLMPPAITDWLPPEHLAWMVIDVVESMDLKSFYAKYRTNGQGNTAWHPKMMVELLLYAYCNGERSSRKIEKLCQESVAYRVITGNEKPDHSSISRFRQDNPEAMKSLFIESLRLCAEAGLVHVGKVNLDEDEGQRVAGGQPHGAGAGRGDRADAVRGGGEGCGGGRGLWQG